jgi:hypothetical protein
MPVSFNIVPSADGGLDLVKTITTPDSDGNIVTSSSRVPLLLTRGERLPRNTTSTSWESVFMGSTIYVRSSTDGKSCFNRFFSWQILQSLSSLDPISSDNVVFLGEFGQIVQNHLLDYDTSQMKMRQDNGRMLFDVHQHRILIGGIGKTNTKTFSLQVKTKVVKGKHTIDRKDGIYVERLKKSKLK